jgi:Reverse transcriptase (RNA-dependent DNA polymerase)
MEQSLKFFNFGDTFIRWVKLLCTNREACIIFNENKLGKNFKLERGNAQGDTISPFLFNICYQILLFKLEYDLQIKNLGTTDPVPAAPVHPCAIPVSNYAKKVFTFADNCNIACRRDEGSINHLKTILVDFARISGIECNLEKTASVYKIH